MFSDDERDKLRTLGSMANVALERARLNRVDAEREIVKWIGNDQRFAGYDANALARRVSQCRDNGAKLDLDAPELRKGGQRRPLDRSTWGD